MAQTASMRPPDRRLRGFFVRAKQCIDITRHSERLPLSTSTTDKAATDEARQDGVSATGLRDGRPLLWPFSDWRVAFGLVVATALMLVVFNRFAWIDIAVADLFFVEAPCAEGAATERCGTFPAASSTVLNSIRDVLHVLPPALAAVLLVYAIAAGFSKDRARVVHARGAATAVASLVICALGLVNFVLKEYSGRPRPQFTDLFGGQHPFVEAGRFADYCAANCSFVSGEASAAFWLLCLVPLAPRRLRAFAEIAALLVASTAAGLRMAFGAHYLSDVTIAAMLSLSVFALLATLGARLGWYRT